VLGDLPCTLVTVYTFCIFGRIILSWFPMEPTGPLAGVRSFLFTITEPVLGPLRRAIPAVGMLDLSPLVAIIGLQIVAGVVFNCR
jgi:YggT family protein